MLEDYLGNYLKKRGFKSYTEVRAQQNANRQVTLLNGDLMNNLYQHTKGVNARVIKNGAYGFASSSHYSADEADLDQVLNAAESNAALLDAKAGLNQPPFPANRAQSREDGLEMALPLSSKKLMDFANELDAYITERYPKLLSRMVRVNMNEVEKLLYTSEGVRSHSYFPRSNVMINLSMLAKDGSPVEIYKVLGGLGSFTTKFPDPKFVFTELERLAEALERKAEGVFPEPGIKDVVLDSNIAGLLAHEAIGHTVEADLVRGGSVAGPNFGKMVASELVSLYDFANTAFGQPCPVPVYVDDEGTSAQDAHLISEGKLTAFMHNRESAQGLGHEPLGNARANEFQDEPLIRMRNTCILPGESKVEEMIGAIKHGYYLKGSNNGQADMTSEFMFGIVEGYEINDGKLGRAIRDTTISGIAFEVLKTVDMLGDTLSWSNGGWCGKKQMILVGMGGPAVKCKVNIGGRA
ncbi:MAG: TldD/PmbA family protein [Anaerolineaceae bacterium]|nr:TldD/PmbA family protein [Anaerolineaceae bacterium]